MEFKMLDNKNHGKVGDELKENIKRVQDYLLYQLILLFMPIKSCIRSSVK
jgi:hypothetical protein